MIFDIYQELLTKKQRDYFTAYYFDDLSITEIADNFEVSRNAVFDQIKKVCANLMTYEDKLKICKRNKSLKEILEIEDIKLLKSKIEKIIEE